MTASRYPTIFVTRYMGAKYKLLDLIVPRLHTLLDPEATLVDLMAGTHSVGYAMKLRNRIVSTDVQSYSAVFGRALITNNSVPTLRHRIAEDGLDVVEPLVADGWFTVTYADTYFSEDQCREIEALRRAIDEVDCAEARDLYLVSLAYAMSLCQSTPGHFAQYMPMEHPRIQELRKLSIVDAFLRKCETVEVACSEFVNSVDCENALNLGESGSVYDAAPAGSLAYLDPPYSAAQYSRFYHLLETVIRADRPNVEHKGLYRDDRYQSPFCSTKNALQAFQSVLKGCRARKWNIAISYSSHGVVRLDDLIALCRAFYQSVEVDRELYAHSTQGRGQVRDRVEVLIACSS